MALWHRLLSKQTEFESIILDLPKHSGPGTLRRLENLLKSGKINTNVYVGDKHALDAFLESLKTYRREYEDLNRGAYKKSKKNYSAEKIEHIWQDVTARYGQVTEAFIDADVDLGELIDNETIWQRRWQQIRYLPVLAVEKLARRYPSVLTMPDKHGETIAFDILHHASHIDPMGKSDLIKFLAILTKTGLDISIKDKQGITAVQKYVRDEHMDYNAVRAHVQTFTDLKADALATAFNEELPRLYKHELRKHLIESAAQKRKNPVRRILTNTLRAVNQTPKLAFAKRRMLMRAILEKNRELVKT